MDVPFLDVRAAYLEMKEPIDEALARVLDSGWYILGEEVERFEEKFAAYCGAAHCIGVGNGLDALVLGLRALDIGPGDEVIVPANTYIATWLAVSAVGAVCVPVEPEVAGCNINCDRIEEAISPRTRAILPVHLFGHPADMASIRQLADTYQLKILDDCAQAHGARFQGKPIGSFADISAYSFYPGKNLGALGDGGAVITSDPKLARRVRLLGNYGSEKKYNHSVRGTNSRLDPLQAAALSVKLETLDDWNLRRTNIASKYISGLANLPVSLIKTQHEGESVWHIFAIQTPQRDLLMSHLAEQHIATLIHYPTPPHLSGAYTDSNLHTYSLPVTEQKADELLSLPIGPHLAATQQSFVISQIKAFFEKNPL